MKTILHKVRLAAGIAALLLPALTTPAAFFTSNTTIGPGNTNYDGQDIVVYNCTLTVDGVHNFSDVLLVNNAILTHTFSSNGSLTLIPQAPPYTVSTGVNLVISNNLVVESGSAIFADGKGFGGTYGPGTGGTLLGDYPYGPPFYYYSGGGGAYGGFGGASLGGAAGGNANGAVLVPNNLGSAGGAGEDVGGAGGGSIILKVGGDVLVDGQITANGADGVNSGSGGGAGGSIWLTGHSIEGGGVISANGGAGEEFTGGGGGGGRISLSVATNDFSGMITAYGGVGAMNGGAGTVFTISSNLGNTVYGQVLADNGGAMGTNTMMDTGQPFDLTISGGAVVPIGSAKLGNLLIASNSWLIGAPTIAAPMVYLNLASNATIQPGGGILTDGQGGAAGIGIGGLYTSNNFLSGGGGGYGGYGAVGLGSQEKLGGIPYGSTMSPSQSGSGGGAGAGNSPYNAGGYGGGLIQLVVPGTLQLGGAISANGLPGAGEGSGGGSGGGILLTVGKLTGMGVVSANGGMGQLPLGGGGGGGRIAIYAGTNQFAGSVTAYGATGYAIGGAGTIFFATNSTPVITNIVTGFPLVLVDNGGKRGTNTLLGAMSGTFDLAITNGGSVAPMNINSLITVRNLNIAANSFLTISQAATSLQFTVTGNATIQPGGGIIVDGLGYPGGTSSTGNGGLGITNGIYTGGGGGHGGYGGASAGGGPGGITYGSISEPTEFGSPGASTLGNVPFNSGGSGGGYVLLMVTGTLQVGGTISANGNPGVGQGSGGGSGGSIRLTTSLLTGNGTISANGGAGESVLGGGGGGGRIAIAFSSNQFSGAITAHGGVGYVPGGAGTIYMYSNFYQIGQVIVDNGGLVGSNTPLPSLSTADLTLTNGGKVALSPGTSLLVRNLLIGSNSVLTFTTPSTTVNTARVSGNASILAGGAIILDGLGSGPNLAGSGAGSSGFSNGITMGGGGAFGGNGGNAANGVLGGTYFGSFNQPENAGGIGGAGSGTSPFNFGGSGGGSMQMTVAGNLLVAGRISANGAPGIGQGSGGGAGGGLFLTAGTISGNGTISANGGAGEPSLGGGGGGGGGRIALYPATNLFTGTVSAYGGNGFVPGGAGSIYLQISNSGVAQVLVDNGGQRGAPTPLAPSGTMFDLTVTNGAIMSATGTMSSIRNLLIASNSVLNIYTNSGQTIGLNLTVVSNATVQATGGIILDGQGTYIGTQQGVGGSALSNGVITGGGGGYGGYGGASGIGVAGGNAYGTISAPAAIGSAGGAGAGTAPNNRGGFGGSQVELNVTGILQVNGTISANGSAGLGEASGGGSGGSVYLTAGTLSGSGILSANGGAGEPSFGGGGGGGGRIALILASNQFTGGIFAHGGTGGVNGGAGTIYLSTKTNSEPLLIADNGGLRGTNTPLSGVQENIDLLVTNGAVISQNGTYNFRNLVVASNSFIKSANLQTPVSLTLEISGSAIIQAGGGVVADGCGYSGIQSGPGSGATFATNGSSYGTGGGYGGNGGTSAAGGAGGITYGSASEPTQSGSSGGRGNGNSPFNVGGSGGGFIQMNVQGPLQLNGIISVNGTAGVGEGSGGGAGGGVQITSLSFSGNGAINANGGAGESVPGGGGGGGRIAVNFQSNLFSGTLTAFGGPGFVPGSEGTIYTKSNISQFGLLVMDGGASPGNNLTALSFNGPTVDLLLTNGAKVSAVTTRLFVHNLVLVSNTVLSLAGTNGFLAAGLTVQGNATIQPGAQIVADGGGFNGNGGHGAGTAGTSAQGYTMGTGGSYGGYGGGTALSAVVGSSYDTITHPTSVGSGGGCVFQPFSQSAGGGTVQMTVTGVLDVEGSISANGVTPTIEGCGGGSGGSIQMTVGTLTGAGSISANGGAGALPYSGGGGGGRIAIYYQSNHFTGPIVARGGQGYIGGGAGTVYTKTNFGNNPVGFVVIDNGGLHGTNTLLSSPEAFNLTVSGNAIGLTPPVTSPLTDPTLFLGNLLVQSNGLITTASANDNASIIVFGNATVATNGSISADGEGYNGTGTGGAGPGAGMMLSGGTNSGSGGGYGGAGGASASGEPGGLAYGSSLQPTNWGSQGGVPSTSYSNFSQGGGAIRLQVAGTLTVNGSVSANGKTGLVENLGGSAGGSLWLSAGALNGNGRISANGGAGEPVTGGGGGGGRIALYYITNNFAGATTAAGGAGASPGQSGSIVTTNLSAPQILSQYPTSPQSNPVSSVVLNLSSELGQSALPLANVTITTPAGVLPSASLVYGGFNVYPQDDSQVTISFPAQTAVGTYTVEVDPPVTDMFGLSLLAPYIGAFTIPNPSISGNVSDTNGAPISGATIQPSGGLASAATDVNGNYSLAVPTGWTGTITPAALGLAFVPSSMGYTNLSALVSQNFLALPPAAFTFSATPSGPNCNLGWFGFSGVNYQVYCSSNLVDWQAYGSPIAGGNTLISLSFPTTNAQQMFFKFGASY